MTAQLWQLPGTSTDGRGIAGLRRWQVQAIWWMMEDHTVKNFFLFFFLNILWDNFIIKPNATKNAYH